MFNLERHRLVGEYSVFVAFGLFHSRELGERIAVCCLEMSHVVGEEGRIVF